MSEILLRADEATTEGSNVQTVAGEIGETMTSLQTRLSSLSDSFKGQTAVAWDEKMGLLHTAHNDVMTALNGLGTFLVSAANTLTDVDTQLANQLNS